MLHFVDDRVDFVFLQIHEGRQLMKRSAVLQLLSCLQSNACSSLCVLLSFFRLRLKHLLVHFVVRQQSRRRLQPEIKNKEEHRKGDKEKTMKKQEEEKKKKKRFSEHCASQDVVTIGENTKRV